MSLQLFRINRVFLLMIFCLSTHSYVFAQSKNKHKESSFFENVRFGGSLGASFSDNAFSAYLAPKAIYDFNQITSAGIGIAGSYTNADNFSAHSISGSLLGILHPIQNIQLSVEFEENYVSRNWELDGANKEDNYWYPALFVGAGYRAGQVTAGIRYDILFDAQKSIYGSAFVPFISFYF